MVDEPPKSKRDKNDVCLLKLETISIGRYISPESFICLLSASPMITHIDVTDCNVLTEESLKVICLSHSFSFLTELKLFACPNVTKEVISLFMMQSNPLSKIVVAKCPLINANHFQELRETVMKKNLNLSIMINNMEIIS